MVKPLSSKGEVPSWKPTYGEGFESQARHKDTNPRTRYRNSAHDVSMGRGVLSSKPTTNPTTNPTINLTREDASLLLDTGFTTKPYTRVYGYVVKPVSSTKVSGERTSITGGVVT